MLIWLIFACRTSLVISCGILWASMLLLGWIGLARSAQRYQSRIPPLLACALNRPIPPRSSSCLFLTISISETRISIVPPRRLQGTSSIPPLVNMRQFWSESKGANLCKGHHAGTAAQVRSPPRHLPPHSQALDPASRLIPALVELRVECALALGQLTMSTKRLAILFNTSSCHFRRCH